MARTAMAPPRRDAECSASHGRGRRMQEELEARARRVLSAEPTRSMPAGRLRERLVAEMGDRVASAGQLIRELGTQPGFLVLDAPVTLLDALTQSGAVGAEDGSLLARYRDALGEAMADGDTRIVLEDTVAANGHSIFPLVARSIIELARGAPDDSALRRVMNTALADAERVARALSASADHSTTPPHDPPPPARTQPRAPRRSSRRLRSEECR